MPVDYKEYGKGWKELSLKIRFGRAKGRCEQCGAEHGKPHPETGSIVILTTAHLNHNIKDNRKKNLAALCQKCHLNHDRQYHIYNRKYGKDTRTENYNLFSEHENNGLRPRKILERIKKIFLFKM